MRSFAKEKASTDRYGGAQDQVVKWGLFSARASGFFFGFNSVVGTGSIVFVLWFGARQVNVAFSLLMPRNEGANFVTVAYCACECCVMHCNHHSVFWGSESPRR